MRACWNLSILINRQPFICICKLFEINIFKPSNQTSSLYLKLIEQLIYEGKTGIKLIKIQLCGANQSRNLNSCKRQLFVAIFWKISKIVTKSSILHVTAVLKSVVLKPSQMLQWSYNQQQQLQFRSKWSQMRQQNLLQQNQKKKHE